MAELLFRVLEAEQRRHPDPPVPAHCLRKLLAAIERDASDTAPPDTSLPESLSEREREDLQLIVAGKPNRTVASDLFVSPGPSTPNSTTSIASSMRTAVRKRWQGPGN